MPTHIEEKLKKALPVEITFPAGTIWLPVSRLTIDDWLTSVAETDQEFSELSIPRMRFLQNRWPVSRLVELEWDDEFSNKRVIAAMYVGQRVYILLSDWSEYQVIAAIEPKDNASLYGTVIGKILGNRELIRTRPRHIWNRRPDLVPELFGMSRTDLDRKNSVGGEDFGDLEGSVDWMRHRSRPDKQWKHFMSHILVGWIGEWLNTPEVGFWYEDVPQSIRRAEKEWNCDEVQADVWRQAAGSSKARKRTAA